MAIIYTYPRLLNPDGTELIVVSETKNQNATRLLTVGDICSFCEGGSGSGCTDTFKYIQTTSPARATANAGCGDELVFQSSDASVTITNAGKVIDFVAVGGGGGSCPTTYVIKPVCCEGDPIVCTIQENYEEWLYTCDETLGAMAPGYIVDLKFNGLDLRHPCDPSTCWWIEELTMSATAAADCAECCPINYQLTPCDEQFPTRYTNDANSSGPSLAVISDYDGKVIFADAGEGDLCYSVAPGDGPIVTTSITTPLPAFDECVCCVSPNWVYSSCDPEPVSIIIDPTDYPGVGLSLSMPNPCLTIKENTTEDPWKCYNFDTCTEEDKTGVYFEVAPSLVVPCCDDPLCAANYKYIPCEGNPIGYDEEIVVDVNPGYASGTVIESPAGGDAIACYTIVYPTLDLLTGVAPVITDAYETPPIVGCSCCMTSIRRYDWCDDPGNYIYIDVIDYGFSKSTPPTCIKVEYSEGTKCFELVDCEIGALEPGIISILDNSPECCEDPDCQVVATLRYEKCPSEICGDAPGSLPQYLYFIDNGSMPQHILVTDQSAGGQTWCYFLNDDAQNLPETPGYSYLSKSHEESCCPCEVYEYYSCEDPGISLYTNNAGILAPGLGTWTILGSTTCYETIGIVPLPAPDLVINDIILENSYPDCECCASGVNPNMHEYSICDDYDPAPVGAPATIWVDITAWLVWNPVGYHPDYISADVGIVPPQNVCYQWVRQSCEPPDATYINDWADCPACIIANAPQMLELKECSGDTYEYVLAGYFDPDITGLSDAAVINVSSGALSAIDECWTITDMNSGAAATQSGMHDWTGPMADPGGDLTPCECCYQHLYEYNICNDGEFCDEAAPATLIIDLGAYGANTWPVVPPIIRAAEIASGIECCYTVGDPLTCRDWELVTGTYVMTVTDCDDETDCVIV